MLEATLAQESLQQEPAVPETLGAKQLRGEKEEKAGERWQDLDFAGAL